MMKTREQDIAEFIRYQRTAVWWKRLPIIRHVRYFRTMRRINEHYEAWLEIGQLPVQRDYDYAMADAIWRGEK